MLSLLESAARRRGRIWSSLNDEDKGALAYFVQSALNEAWRFALWPQVVRVEPVPVVAEWSAGTAYAAGAVVWYADTSDYWLAGPSGALATDVPGVAASWTATTPAARDLDLVVSVTFADPRDDDRAQRTPFHIGPWGLSMPEVAPGTTVWVRYRPSPPLVAWLAWDAETTYAAGDLVLAASGVSYLALAASTNSAPAPGNANWSAQTGADFLYDPVATKAAALSLRADGQWEQAAAATADALAALVSARDRAKQATSLRW